MEALTLLTSAAPAKCAPDSAQVGPVCVDKYEASMREIPAVSANNGLISKVKKSAVTLAT